MSLRIALFYHSLVSDWNHGNAHFLRGVCSELIARGHEIRIFEPENGWSRANLIEQEGSGALTDFAQAYPHLQSELYSQTSLNLEQALDGIDFVLLHEWNEPWLVKAVAAYRRQNRGVRIFFHDTHHRAISDPNSLIVDDIAEYDAVLAYGESLREVYQQHHWAKNVHVWHEAADTRVFRPLRAPEQLLDVAWIGNWGDEERAAELDQFLLRPSAALSLQGTAHGVRYPEAAISRMRAAGFTYKGWLANHRVPEVFAAHRVTVHVPRRPYLALLPGIPTIRPFEAMACGIPLIISQWRDTEGLFREGVDFLSANSETQMQGLLHDVLTDANLRESLRRKGLETIYRRHTCAHRVDELLNIYLQSNKQAPLAAVAG